jgi:hypothetical protein
MHGFTSVLRIVFDIDITQVFPFFGLLRLPSTPQSSAIVVWSNKGCHQLLCGFG